MGGDAWLGSDASESNFKKQAGQYAIIHLASHAMVDDGHPQYSKILFAADPDSLEDGALEVSELFNLSLPAELVVLSACETGIGRLQKGEGIVSLARGMAYAGAKSVVTTLWPVNDAATSDIMQNFYESLNQKNSKSEALRLAKLAYIESGDHLSAQPFYWAAFIPIGDMRPLPSKNHHWIWGLIALGIGASGLMYYRRKRKL